MNHHLQKEKNYNINSSNCYNSSTSIVGSSGDGGSNYSTSTSRNPARVPSQYTNSKSLKGKMLPLIVEENKTHKERHVSTLMLRRTQYMQTTSSLFPFFLPSVHSFSNFLICMEEYLDGFSY